MDTIEIFTEMARARERLGIVEHATPTKADLVAIRGHSAKDWSMVIAESERRYRDSEDPEARRMACRYFNPVVLGRRKNFDRVLRWAREREALPPPRKEVGEVLYEMSQSGTWMIVGIVGERGEG